MRISSKFFFLFYKFIKFKAPEILYPKNYPLVRKVYSKKSDVYSYGLVLAHIISGKVPFLSYRKIDVRVNYI